MALPAAVVAGNLGSIGAFRLLLGTVLGDMTKLLAVAAQGYTLVDDLSSVVKARKEFVPVLGPTLNLTRTVRLLSEAVRDRVLLAYVSLEVHVGEDLKKGLLGSNQPETDVFLNESGLDITVSGLSVGRLDVLLDALLGVVNVSLSNGLLDLVQGLLERDISNVVAVDLASVLAVLAHVACEDVSEAHAMEHCETNLLHHSSRRPWEACQGNPSPCDQAACSSGRPSPEGWGTQHDGDWKCQYVRNK